MLELELQSYYGVYGGQQFSPYLTTAGGSGAAAMYHNFYPLYAQYAQGSQLHHGFNVQYPHLVQYPYLPQHYGSTGILSLPSSMAVTSTTTTPGKVSTSLCRLYLSLFINMLLRACLV